jgi:hypothetical protein
VAAPGELELEVTVLRSPLLPVPTLLTVSAKRCRLKLAVTDFAAFIVREQVAPEAVSHPLQPAKSDPVATWAVRVTGVPLI